MLGNGLKGLLGTLKAKMAKFEIFSTYKYSIFIDIIRRLQN